MWICPANGQNTSPFSFDGLGIKDTLKVLSQNDSVTFKRFNNDERIDWGQKLLAWSEPLNYRKGICIALTQIGYGFDGNQNVDRAIDYYYKALAIANEINFSSNIITLNNYLGIIYSTQGQHKKAIYHFRKMYELGMLVKEDFAIGAGANNIGIEYLELKQPVLALSYFKKCIAIYANTTKHSVLTEVYANSILAYVALNELDSARAYVSKALYEAAKSKYKEYDLPTAYLAVGKYYDAVNDFKRAEFYLKKSMSELPEPNYGYMRDASKYLTRIYEKQGLIQKAHEMYKLQMSYNDSILSENRQKQITDAESRFNNLKWEYELQKEKNAVITKSLQLKKNRTILLLVSSLALVLCAALFFIYRLFRDKRKAHRQLAEQKKEILDSIHYSKRIQLGILPSEQTLTEIMGEHFVLFKPKDIVSGDFYWVSPSDADSFFIACCDCTGHGVPGAFMSLLGYSLLSKVEELHENNSPAHILNYINNHLPDYFKIESNEGNIKDGMDMSLCKINRTKGEVAYSGANNSIYHISESELKVIKAQKQAISADKSAIKQAFEDTTFKVKNGDWIILLTDGYADQFGGPKGKKFKYKQLEELLFNARLSSTEQFQKKLHDTLEQWKGKLEQVDDVCVIGIKI